MAYLAANNALFPAISGMEFVVEVIGSVCTSPVAAGKDASAHVLRSLQRPKRFWLQLWSMSMPSPIHLQLR